MKKILGYLTVLLVFSWGAAANASIAAFTASGATGTTTVTGFADGTPSTISILLDYTSGATTLMDVVQPIGIGGTYHIATGFTLTGIDNIAPAFDVVAQHNVAVGTPTLNTLFSSLFPTTASFAPPSVFSIGNSVLDLTSVAFGTDALPAHNATITLFATIVSGNLATTLTNTAIAQGHAGTAITSFTNGTITVVPEPATMLLLSAGLLGFGYSRKRA